MRTNRALGRWQACRALLWMPIILMLSSSMALADMESRDSRSRVRLKESAPHAVTTERHDDDPRFRFPLRFKSGGTFKIVQFTDTQDDQNIDPRTVALIEAVLDSERPDLVVFTGDNITKTKEGPNTPADVRKAIDNIVAPVNDRNIPFFITFGNHDEDHTPVTGVDEKGMLEIYRSYRYNINRRSPENVTGTGNMHALIYGSQGLRPVFNVWGLDSGRYAPEKIAEQTIEDDFLLGWTWMPDWDWIRPDQIAWYRSTSEKLEKTYGKKVPSLMFFHIPLQEFRQMYENRKNHEVVGTGYTLPDGTEVVGRFEDECPGPFNSGLFSALLERGDVKGVFVGHDHVNDYTGNYFGVRLGYSASTGFGTYGLGGEMDHFLRGARVFVVRDDNPSTFETYMVYARNYGIQ